MGIICSNCKTSISCSCQKRTASDGKSCCSKCVAKYEQSLKPSSSPTSAPSNVKVIYTPKKNV